MRLRTAAEESYGKGRHRAETGLAYGSFYQIWEAEPDEELIWVRPRTACGVHMRRF